MESYSKTVGCEGEQMRDSILRVIDDLGTRREACRQIEIDTDNKTDRISVAQNFMCSGSIAALNYAINRLGEVLDDHPNPKSE